MTDDQLRDILHHATHCALPARHLVHGGVVERSRIQVEIANFVIGAIRACEHGADSFGGLCFEKNDKGDHK